MHGTCTKKNFEEKLKEPYSNLSRVSQKTRAGRLAKVRQEPRAIMAPSLAATSLALSRPWSSQACIAAKHQEIAAIFFTNGTFHYRRTACLWYGRPIRQKYRDIDKFLRALHRSFLNFARDRQLRSCRVGSSQSAETIPKPYGIFCLQVPELVSRDCFTVLGLVDSAGLSRYRSNCTVPRSLI